ncbi:MAG: fimbrillin family protein [Prevotella sp.]|nr:fimbrillin family protein [Prevotella sp.]
MEFTVSVPSWKGEDSPSKTESRATPITDPTLGTDKSFNLIADQKEVTGSYSTLIDNETVTCSNSLWKTTKDYYWSGTDSKTVNFYACYPASIPNGTITHTAGSAPTLTYTVPDDAANQTDILTAFSPDVSGSTGTAIPLTFKHILSAVQFSVGTSGMPSGTISKVTLNNIQYKGTYSLDGTWTPSTTDKKPFSQTVSASSNAGTVITSSTMTFMMMPQTLSDASITVTYSNGGTLTKAITGTWEAGNTYTYNLSKTIPIANFDYTGNVQTYTVPLTGTYKIECWGAQGFGAWQGGNITDGYGGYSYGDIKLRSGQMLYIYVGGYDPYKEFEGADNDVYNSYNGGGIGEARGGGATHIATTNRGELRNYISYQDEVIIVAGGGGGLEWGGKGGDGGGMTGNNGNSQANNTFAQSASAMGGSQTSGGISVAFSAYENSSILVNGSFGQGGDGYENSDKDYGAGGGGGWYGGGGTSVSGAGGGGSGHLGSSLINGTTGMQNGIRLGNGYARITFVSAN